MQGCCFRHDVQGVPGLLLVCQNTGSLVQQLHWPHKHVRTCQLKRWISRLLVAAPYLHARAHELGCQMSCLIGAAAHTICMCARTAAGAHSVTCLHNHTASGSAAVNPEAALTRHKTPRCSSTCLRCRSTGLLHIAKSHQDRCALSPEASLLQLLLP